MTDAAWGGNAGLKITSVTVERLDEDEQVTLHLGNYTYTFTGPMQAGTIDANGKFTPISDGLRPDPGDEQPPADDPIDYANRPARGGYF